LELIDPTTEGQPQWARTVASHAVQIVISQPNWKPEIRKLCL